MYKGKPPEQAYRNEKIDWTIDPQILHSYSLHYIRRCFSASSMALAFSISSLLVFCHFHSSILRRGIIRIESYLFQV